MTTTTEDAQARRRTLSATSSRPRRISPRVSEASPTTSCTSSGTPGGTLTSSAEAARQKAEQERREARLSGLAAIGARSTSSPGPSTLNSSQTPCARPLSRATRSGCLAAAHDADVAALVAAATDFRAEPAAPAGPRGTSAYIAVKGAAIMHGRVTVSPIGDRIRAALEHAMSGDIGRAIAKVRSVTATPEPRRPDHLLRNARSGMLVPISAS